MFRYPWQSEEVPLYTPKGKRVAQTSQYPPGWFPTVATSAAKTKTEKSKATAGDKLKLKERKEIPKPEREPEFDKIIEKLEDIKMSNQSSNDPTIELSKKLKRLRKRLRECEALDEKIISGEITNPEKDQLEKISRRKEFEEEIEQLEAERLKLRQVNANKNL